jgi:hypothetical protein
VDARALSKTERKLRAALAVNGEKPADWIIKEIRSGEWKRRCARNDRALVESAKGTPLENLGYTAYVAFDDEREERHKRRIQQFCKRLGYHDVQVDTEHVTGPNGEDGIKFMPTRPRDMKLALSREHVATVAIVRRISATPRPRASRRVTRSSVGSRGDPDPPGESDPLGSGWRGVLVASARMHQLLLRRAAAMRTA